MFLQRLTSFTDTVVYSCVSVTGLGKTSIKRDGIYQPKAVLYSTSEAVNRFHSSVLNYISAHIGSSKLTFLDGIIIHWSTTNDFLNTTKLAKQFLTSAKGASRSCSHSIVLGLRMRLADALMFSVVQALTFMHVKLVRSKKSTHVIFAPGLDYLGLPCNDAFLLLCFIRLS